MSSLFNSFKNQPVGAYKPLSLKNPIITTREIRNTGKANKAEFFFLTKPNTIRERATIDLLYPTPSWLRTALQKPAKFAVRIVVTGEERITTDSFLRIVGV